MTSLYHVILAAGRCPCDPTRGQSCRYCDGRDEEERDAARERRRPRRAKPKEATQ